MAQVDGRWRLERHWKPMVPNVGGEQVAAMIRHGSYADSVKLVSVDRVAEADIEVWVATWLVDDDAVNVDVFAALRVIEEAFMGLGRAGS